MDLDGRGSNSSQLLDPRSWADSHFCLIPLVLDMYPLCVPAPQDTRLSTPESASDLCVRLARIPLHSHNGYLAALSGHFGPVTWGHLHSGSGSGGRQGCNCLCGSMGWEEWGGLSVLGCQDGWALRPTYDPENLKSGPWGHLWLCLKQLVDHPPVHVIQMRALNLGYGTRVSRFHPGPQCSWGPQVLWCYGPSIG